MPQRSSSRSARRPWWLLALPVVLTWAYNTFFNSDKPSPSREREASSRERGASTSRTSRPRNESRDESRRRSRDSDVKPVGGQIFRDRVIKVSDGDTVRLENQGSVRLIGVDCPEKAQPGGREATEFTASALLDKTVEVELCARQPVDRYGRGLALVYIGSGSRRVLFNAELVKQGFARVYSLRPCTVDEDEWNGYFEQARAERRGLFRTIGDVPDAASYRREKKARTQTSWNFSARDACEIG